MRAYEHVVERASGSDVDTSEKHGRRVRKGLEIVYTTESSGNRQERLVRTVCRAGDRNNSKGDDNT